MGRLTDKMLEEIFPNDRDRVKFSKGLKRFCDSFKANVPDNNLTVKIMCKLFFHNLIYLYLYLQIQDVRGFYSCRKNVDEWVFSTLQFMKLIDENVTDGTDTGSIGRSSTVDSGDFVRSSTVDVSKEESKSDNFTIQFERVLRSHKKPTLKRDIQKTDTSALELPHGSAVKNKVVGKRKSGTGNQGSVKSNRNPQKKPRKEAGIVCRSKNTANKQNSLPPREYYMRRRKLLA